MQQSTLLKAAITFARDAGPMFRISFGKVKSVQTKKGDHRNLVTEVDLAIEHKLRAAISKRFPDHAIMGEETGGSPDQEKKEYVWILDPIDGTTNYIQGMPYCCISIGIFKNKKPFIGVIYNPVINTLYAAQKGKGATRDGKKITVSNVTTFHSAFGSVGWGKDIPVGSALLKSIIFEAKKIRVLGSHALSMCNVAEGVCDYFLTAGAPGLSCSIWDIAASQLILSEAGGITTDGTGHPLTGFDAPGTIVSSCTQPLQKEIVQFLKKL